jgi:hypothetical protein
MRPDQGSLRPRQERPSSPLGHHPEQPKEQQQFHRLSPPLPQSNHGRLSFPFIKSVGRGAQKVQPRSGDKGRQNLFRGLPERGLPIPV